ncbi:cox cluster protein [Haloarchaeobius sp. HME9146]|uniref:DUF7520 family protein n=1 Tax=Haloarchaeobius sp. HME9146 TaxID=2978732 RepID=UPI0021BE25E0|nr:cox cluster protein [Haloarchaeobius sp. HME9146]MCT9096241.1 cox cluster protein [Haloarchaeobius sp. HME9146]
MSNSISGRFQGNRVVLTVYVVVVALSGVFGAAVGVLLPVDVGRDVDVASIAGIEFAVTPLNFALYGMAMVGISLGLLLLLVRFVSRYDDDAVAE